MYKAVLLGDARQIQRVYTAPIIEQICQLVELYREPIEKKDLDRCAGILREADFVFSTWGMLALDENEIKARFPKLKHVFYAAGSVQFFARPFLNLGIGVSSAWAANAVPVIEYTTALILLGLKGFFPAAQLVKAGKWSEGSRVTDCHHHIYGATVGIIGAGMIGKGVLEALSRHDVNKWVYDPFLSYEKAESLGAHKTDSLVELFENCAVVSNHVANLPSTKGMLRYEHFSHMASYTCFINSGRNQQIDEEGFVRAFREDPTRTAILDVTDPQEPPAPDHPYLALPNVIITPHIAGTRSDELARMSGYMADELKRRLADEPLRWNVTLKMLETMA